MEKQEAKLINALLDEFVKKQGLEDELLRIRIFDAWDEAVGERVAAATVGKYYKDGVLHCTISSSVIKSQLLFQQEAILKKINTQLGGRQVVKLQLK